MKKFIFSLLFVVCSLWSSARAAETLELLTYYPAPYGVYQNLKATQQVWIGNTNGVPLSGGNGKLQIGNTTNQSCSLYTYYTNTNNPVGYALYANNPTGTAIYANGGLGTYYAIHGYNSAGGTAIYGYSSFLYGVVGESNTLDGVVGRTAANGFAGVRGTNSNSGYGVVGDGGTGVGVYGLASSGVAVKGSSSTWDSYGVFGTNAVGTAIKGVSSGADANYSFGVYGVSDNANGRGVYGASTNGYGVVGYSGGANDTIWGRNVGTGIGIHGTAAVKLILLTVK